jgi:hypothetical protein
MDRVIVALLLAMQLLASPVANAAEFSLWPQLEIAGAYDDNTHLTPTKRKGDFLTFQSPGATLKGSSSRRDFYLTYQTLMLEYANYSRRDRFLRDDYLDLQDNERLSPDTTLSINETFLLGNSTGGGVITNNKVPLGSQVMQTLLSNSNAMGSTFVINLLSRYSNSFSWTANINQNTLSLLSNNPQSKYNFSQGVSLAGDWDMGERLTGGVGYSFTDFRFSNRAMPRTQSNMLAMRLGWGAGTPFRVLGQVGPVVSLSSPGEIGKTSLPSQTSVDVGFLVKAEYDSRRLSMTGTFSQAPSISNGLAGVATTADTFTGLVQYKLSRRATIFSNGGYYSTSSASSSSRVIAYTAGISYLFNETLALNFNYVGYSTLANGIGAAALVQVPGKDTVTNLVIVGITVHPEPLRWKW